MKKREQVPPTQSFLSMISFIFKRFYKYAYKVLI